MGTNYGSASRVRSTGRRSISSGSRDNANKASRPAQPPITDPDTLLEIRADDELVRVDLNGVRVHTVLIVHRLTREYVFLDTGYAACSLTREDQDELLLALEELKIPGAGPLSLRQLSNTPRSARQRMALGC